MGKASSAKKVSRASRAGGGGKISQQRSLTFPVTIAVVLVLGFALVIFASRDNEATADDTEPRANSDHWHAAYGIYACDAFLAPIQVQDDPEGIHSHADGVIHVHPWVGAAAGKNATLQVFADAVGLELSDDEITVPGVGTFKNGEDCNGEPASWQVAVWNDETSETPTTVVTENFGDIHFDNDRMLITLAFVPEGTEIPKPESQSQLDNLTDVPQSPGAAPTSLVEPGASAPDTSISDTSAPGSSAATTATTAPASATTGS